MLNLLLADDDSDLIEKVKQFRQEKKDHKEEEQTVVQPKVKEIPRITTRERDQILEKIKIDVRHIFN